MKPYPSLHTLSEYSFLESSIRIDDLISFAKEQGLGSLVLTDHNNMFGAAEFIYKCKKNKIKPIVGLDLDINDFRLILIAKNYTGFKELIRLSSNKMYDKDISIDDIDAINLIVIDHPEFGYYKKTEKNLKFNDYFTTNNKTSANYLDIKFTRYLKDKDKASVELLDKIRDEKSGSVFFGNHYQIVSENMSSYEQIKNIVDNIKIDFPKDINPIPKFDKKGNSKILLRRLLNENAPKVLGNKLKKNIYIERVKLETNIIEKLGFEDYFLIIHDLIKWAKANKILIGPGRGSAAGSLVSYILNITEVDPIEHGLLFERFLNPERVSMPDIDIDIQDNKREGVIKYLINKYGVNNVGFISTFQRLAAKGSLREVGRMMGLANGDVLSITKLIPMDSTLESAYKDSTRFRASINSSEKYTKLFEYSKKIEGLPKNLGTHAAGVVISNNHLIETVPIIKSSEGYTQVQYSMNFLEENGLLKIDLLGLRNLTILEDIQKEIFVNHKRKVILNKIPLDDKKTNELLTSGKTNGIFQLESYGMKKTLNQVKISNLNDLVAVISLFRPGPMEFIQKYADVKSGKEKQQLIDNEYDEIVKPTYGIMVYQEQIMQIVQKYANMSFGRADLLRRAIGKKNRNEINSLKQEFIDNSVNNKHSKEQASKIFSLIEKFANYGFNKSHAVSYAILSYRMAYLKSWFPFEFYTSLIKSSISSPNTLKQYINEAKKQNIEILGPKINISKIKAFNQKPNIVLPFSIIKGVGSVANFKIIEEREKNGLFKDFFDFVARIKKHGISDNIILSLIKSGALLEWGHTKKLIDSLPQALRYSQMITKIVNKEKEIDFSILQKPRLIESEENIESDIKNENDVIGFNISIFSTSPFELKNKIKDVKSNTKLTVVAKVSRTKKIKDKNGNNMGIILLEDSSMEIEVFVFSTVYKFIENTKNNSIVKATIEYKNNGYILNKNWEVLNEG